MSYHDIGHRLHKLTSSSMKPSDDNIVQTLKALMQCCRGQEMESKRVLTSVVKLSHIKDTRVKRLVYMYLSLVSDDESEMWLQITNSIANDLAHPSPAVRQSALLVLTDSHSFSEVVNDIRVSSVMKCLKDSNSNIRRTAISGCGKLFALFSNKGVAVDFGPIFQMLSQMIYTDHNAEVIVECIRCLKLCGQGALKMDLFLSLLERLDMVGNWTKAEIVHLFNTYADPLKMTHEMIFQVLNLLDPFLDHKYPIYLSLSCIVAMLNVSKQFSNIHSDVRERIMDFLLSGITFSSRDNLSLILPVLNIITTRKSLPKLISHYKSFLILPGDNSYVKLQKISLLGKVCDEANATIIFTQLASCAMTSREEDLIILSVASLFNVYSYLPCQCEQFLRHLLKHSNPVHVDVALVTLMQVKCSKVRTDNATPITIFDECYNVYENILSYEAKSTYFWFFLMNPIKEHTRIVLQILSVEEAKWESIDSASFKLYLLQVIMRLFFLMPKASKPLLGKILQKASRSNNLLLNRQAFLYYKLLTHDIDIAKKFFSQLPLPQIVAEVSTPSEFIDVEKLKGMSLLCLK